ncbi:MAG: phosphatase [Lachnospiraceae bacterium]|nr:phosphatase [Lachnospiraceae bacterium]
MKYVLDSHTHTLASGHAYSTIREMAYMAREKGLELLGITEHGPAMPGSCHDFYFSNLRVASRTMCGVELLLGVELNILDYNGTVDLPQRILRQMDIAIVSMHIPCIKPGTREENTRAYLKAIENPYVNIIGHPDDARYAIDYKELVLGAKEHGVLIEINNASMQPGGPRVGAMENDREILNLCRQYHVPVILGSDAHVDEGILNFTYPDQLLRELDFPEELVVNTSVDRLKKYANKYK